MMTVVCLVCWRLASMKTHQSPKCVQQQSHMSNELTNVLSLESQLVASRQEIECESNENTGLRTIIELLEEELDGYTMSCKSPKKGNKSVDNKKTPDNLLWELSYFSGMQRFTGPNGQAPIEDISEQLNITKTKPESLKDHVMNAASSLNNVLEDYDPVPITTKSEIGIPRGSRRTNTGQPHSCDYELCNKISRCHLSTLQLQGGASQYPDPIADGLTTVRTESLKDTMIICISWICTEILHKIERVQLHSMEKQNPSLG